MRTRSTGGRRSAGVALVLAGVLADPDRHDSTVQHDSGPGHDQGTTTRERPLKAVLGGFVALDAAAMTSAACLRRRDRSAARGAPGSTRPPPGRYPPPSGAPPVPLLRSPALALAPCPALIGRLGALDVALFPFPMAHRVQSSPSVQSGPRPAVLRRRPTTRGERMRITGWKLAAVAAVTGLSLTACGSTVPTAGEGPAASEPPAAGEGPAASASGVPTVPDEAAHVHGMGINPADGRLYLGTHGGTMVVEPDAVRRVGDATIDLMGFAVAGPDHFVASGHPGPADDLPNPVGLIESTDAGATWTSLSLAGRSDFHTLTASGGTVYGFDGIVKSTSDGTTWTPGAADVRPASLAVDPGDPQVVLATTEHGPVRSTDGGRTFEHLDGAPLLVFLAWTAPDALWAVAPDGAVHRSADGGATWSRAGTAGGPPEAFAAHGADTVAVALADRIVQSTDGGATFTSVADRR
jgi:hypothetical protein